MNSFANIINFIMYLIDLIQGWFGGASNDDNNDQPEGGAVQ